MSERPRAVGDDAGDAAGDADGELLCLPPLPVLRLSGALRVPPPPPPTLPRRAMLLLLLLLTDSPRLPTVAVRASGVRDGVDAAAAAAAGAGAGAGAAGVEVTTTGGA